MLFFEVKVKYDKMMENGVIKSVTETYALDALSFTEAEARITDKMRPYISGEFQVMAEKRANYSEAVLDDEGDLFFLVKYNYITVDPTTEKEKRSPNYVLFRQPDIDNAKEKAHDHMRRCMVDYEIEFIKETKIVDVFLYSDVKMSVEAAPTE